jgi:hypothetical protein
LSTLNQRVSRRASRTRGPTSRVSPRSSSSATAQPRSFFVTGAIPLDSNRCTRGQGRRSAATVRKASHIGCRMASTCANVKLFFPHAILASDNNAARRDAAPAKAAGDFHHRAAITSPVTPPGMGRNLVTVRLRHRSCQRERRPPRSPSGGGPPRFAKRRLRRRPSVHHRSGSPRRDLRQWTGQGLRR